MRTTSPSARRGFTIVEAVVALVLITVGLLTLEAGAVCALRRVRDSRREALAAQLVQTRTARILAAACVSSSGVDSTDAVVITWSASATDGILRVDQTARYPTTVGPHVESYHTAKGCP